MTRRPVHPVAWWAWGLLLGAAALRITNPLLTGLLIAAVWVVVAARRRNVPWARSFTMFFRLGLVVLGVRLVLQAVFGARIPGRVLFTLPEAELPGWAAGVNLGGPVTAEALLQAGYATLPLIGLLAAVGAANSLADPYRLLRALPTALHEAGVALAVACSVAPQAGVAAVQVRDARRLRGRPTRGLAALRGIALPVLEGALDRSVALAASMDARGFGRRALIDPARRRTTRLASGGGLVAVAVGTYGALDAGSPTALGLPLLAAGAVLLAVGLGSAGTPNHRTRYRPDRWGLPEWATVGSGLAVLAAVVVAGRVGADLSAPSGLALPSLPLAPAAALLLVALPAWATPEPPS